MMARELAEYGCPGCSGQLVRDNTSAPRFRCESCEAKVHEAVAENADALSRLADRGDGVGDIARRLLETGGVSQ